MEDDIDVRRPPEDPTPRLHRAGHVVAGRYRIRNLLAVGGMGVVYRAVDVTTGRPRAIKTLLPGLVGDAVSVRRFEREAAALGALHHPNLVRVVDAVRDGGQLHLVMELVGGLPLDQVRGLGAMPARRVLPLLRQVLDALEHAHAAGIVHRDLKPPNILVTSARSARGEVERVKVLDFGVARVPAEDGNPRLTRTGFTHGTPEYMAPEQARRKRPVDHRADLYALGVILFELLVGVRPFVAPDAISVMRMHVLEPPPRLADLMAGCTPALDRLVAVALAKDPAHRFADAAEMRDALDLASLSVGATDAPA